MNCACDWRSYLWGMVKGAFAPCIPIRGTKVPDRDDWFHEVKLDGYWLMIQREG
jgi:bifunctional non-homologous end joining protein LigD